MKSQGRQLLDALLLAPFDLANQLGPFAVGGSAKRLHRALGDRARLAGRFPQLLRRLDRFLGRFDFAQGGGVGGVVERPLGRRAAVAPVLVTLGDQGLQPVLRGFERPGLGRELELRRLLIALFQPQQWVQPRGGFAHG